MKNTEILNRFNNEGIFPSDAECQILAETTDLGNDVLDVELNLLDVASSDVNHPYYPATQPIPESQKSEAQKEFEKLIEENSNFSTFGFMKGPFINHALNHCSKILN